MTYAKGHIKKNGGGNIRFPPLPPGGGVCSGARGGGRFQHPITVELSQKPGQKRLSVLSTSMCTPALHWV